MAKGNPNDESRKLNFQAKVWDAQADNGQGAYRPIYIAPEATDKVLGDVLLSDAVDSSDNAATGTTAATPLAVKKANDNANNKLDKTTNSAQSVKSEVAFAGKVTGQNGFVGNLTGDVTGIADRAKVLEPGRSITVKSGAENGGSAQFTGASDITITIPTVDATTVRGVLPLNTIPQGAIEKVVAYESIDAAIAAYNAATGDRPYQIGDTVRVTGVTPNVMYSVIGDPTVESNYVEYAAATATNALNAEHAEVSDKLGTSTIGGAAQPIYLNDGEAAASDASLGSDTKPVYMSNGVITESAGNVGADGQPVYLVAGEITPMAANIGEGNNPVYMEDGSIVASTDTIGANNKPVFMSEGTIQEIDYTIDKSVPEDALFTDTTYDVFKAGTADTEGSNGLVPAPTADEATKFLRGDGTWQLGGEVTGVKGDAETEYRKGNVNLTAANIGALPLSGGTLTGTLSGQAINPSTNDTYSLGTTSLKWSNVYATNFTGNLTGNVTGNATSATTATTANRLNKTLSLTGNVTGSIGLNADGTAILATTIASKAVTLAKLADEVGTVAVQSAEPTDAHVKLWVKI